MDSSGTLPGRLLHYLTRYAPFAGPLRDRLTVIEPSFDYPLALNLFDVDMDRIRGLSGDDRMAALGSARDMVGYVLSGLLGAELTSKQSGVFGYLVEAMMHIPDATIYTLAELLEDNGYEKHRKHILQMDPWARDFFENRFRQQYKVRGATKQAIKNNFAGTKQELFWRIDKMLQEPVFRSMFSHKKNRLDMFAEMQAGKCIIINTHRNLLRETGMETFGRYMLAKIYQAAERRLDVAAKENLPVFVYLDECHDYISREPKVVRLLDQLARKNNIAFTFAHQRPSNLSQDVFNAVSSVALRFASRSEEELAVIAQRLRMDDPATLSSLNQGEFAFLFRETKGARKGILQFPHVDETLPLMTEAQYESIRQDMRARYCAEPAEAPPLVPPQDFDDEETTQGDPDFA
jgi:hypothetical protein